MDRVNTTVYLGDADIWLQLVELFSNIRLRVSEKLPTVEPARATGYQNNTLKQHKALKSVTLEPIPVTSLHNKRFMSPARRTWHFALSNVFLVEGLIVALGTFCTSPVILRRKMAIDFYT